MAFVLLLALVLVAPAQAQTPTPAPAPLTLAQAMAKARTDSPLRRAAVDAAAGTATAATLAGRRLNPLIELRGENWSTSDVQLPLDVFATVTQPIELGPKRRSRLGLAEADRDIASGNLHTMDRQIALRTAQLYVQALKAKGLLDTLTASREGLTILTETMRRRVTEGRSAEADLLKFETDGARIDIDVARARLDLDRGLTALTFVIGATNPVTPGQLVEPASLPGVDATDAAIAAAAQRHPEVQLAAARVTRAQQSLALERARRLPDPLVTAGYKRTAGVDTVLAAVTFALPVFDRNAGAAARALGDVKAAEADRDALVLRLTSEASSLVRVARTLTTQSNRTDQELLPPAEAVRNAARAAFREGASDTLRLIDAERVYADVLRAALELRLEALIATVEARFALGEEALP